jgi:TonB family protein
MYFDFEDYHPETPSLESAISRREGVLLSIVIHVVGLLLLVYVPRLPFVQQAIQEAREAAAVRALELQRARQDAQFVFVQPRLDTKAPAPPTRFEFSDQDRVARTLERPPDASNPLPYMRGNSSDRIESQEEMRAAGEGPGPDASSSADQAEAGESHGSTAYDSGQGSVVVPRSDQAAGTRGASPGGSLGEALRNIQRYLQTQSFDNPQGGTGQFGPAIQFDTKGVEFGPWVRRFIAQIKRNWFVPYAAMTMHGHVVLTFNVHKDGSITDLTVLAPSAVESFNRAAYNALFSSNPTQPLPPEYPADKAFFTVTFYYNESPPAQ